MASQFERVEAKRATDVSFKEGTTLTHGLKGETLVFLRPAVRHSNGAREARRAQQM